MGGKWIYSLGGSRALMGFESNPEIKKSRDLKGGVCFFGARKTCENFQTPNLRITLCCTLTKFKFFKILKYGV